MPNFMGDLGQVEEPWNVGIVRGRRKRQCVGANAPGRWQITARDKDAAPSRLIEPQGLAAPRSKD
jgi:hypothetical protein